MSFRKVAGFLDFFFLKLLGDSSLLVCFPLPALAGVQGSTCHPVFLPEMGFPHPQGVLLQHRSTEFPLLPTLFTLLSFSRYFLI